MGQTHQSDDRGADSPLEGGQETAISRHITTYRQHRQDLGKQPDWDEPTNPNIIYEESNDEVSSSNKDVSDATLPARSTFSIVIFFGEFCQEGQKSDTFYQSKADIAPHAHTVRLPRNRKEGPGAIASWVGV
ncbi:hypothetical protein RND71_042248 [Anisodus tanguticus]|uniref:Uncharacterized protein n=1 Tax=Anisodus tanguticus TaxID=243964 RepID=A0AAE1QQA2_9SOLA|nr:hypothetical protein RND71_042248 [Anisodus tanguticus]